MRLMQSLRGWWVKRGRGRQPAPVPWRPHLEHLETRTVPSTMNGHGVHLNPGQLGTLKTLVHQVEQDVHAIRNHQGATAVLQRAYHQLAHDIRSHQGLMTAVTNLENDLAKLQTKLGTMHPKLSADIAALDTFLHQLTGTSSGQAS